MARGRPRGDVQQATMSFKVAPDLKEKVQAAAWWVANEETPPAEVNVSDFVRDELIEEYLKHLAAQVPGGIDGLLLRFRQARAAEHKKAFDELHAGGL